MTWREHWPATVAAAALLALARAEFSIAEVGYLDAGAWELAWIGSALPFLVTFVLAAPLLRLMAHLWRRLWERPLFALLVPLLGLPVMVLLVGLPWPLDSSNALGMYDAPGRARTLAALLVSCASITLLSPSLPRTLALPPAALGVLAILGFSARFLPRAEAHWPKRPNVILVSIDTQRADHLSCYGYERETSPNIDRFADESVRFTRMFTPYPWTLLSHMSLFTSLNPTAHGVMTDRPLAPGIPTLAEHLRDDGYHTVAILDRVDWLNSRYHFDRGFDVYLQLRGSASEKHRRISPVLDDLGDEPFFLFLHFFDVHSDSDQLPYDSLEDYRRAFAGDYSGEFTGCEEELGCASKYLKGLIAEKRVLEGEDLEYLIALYDAGVRTFDREFGAILEELKQRGLYETSVIALTSDHGEAFFEHGEPLHAGVHDEVVRVPFIVRTPDTRKGRVEDQLLSVIDVAPTLLEFCDVEPGGMQGLSFRELIETENAESRERPDWVILEDGRERWHGIRTDRWKAFRYEDERWVLFDLESDPGEHTNLLRRGATPPAEFAELRERYEAERERMLEFRRKAPRRARLEAVEGSRAELEALGYAAEFE